MVVLLGTVDDPVAVIDEPIVVEVIVDDEVDSIYLIFLS